MLFKGGGRSSARETIGRVAPGALAKKILKQFAGTEVCLLYEFANGIALNVSIYIELFIFLLTFCLFFLTSVLSILVYPCNEDVLSKNRINPIFYRCTLLFHICFWTCLCLSLFFFLSPDSCLCLASPPSCTSRRFGRPREFDTRTGADPF